MGADGVVKNISDHPVCAILTIDAQTPLLWEEGIMSRFMISSLGNGPASAWNNVPNVHSPSGATQRFPTACAAPLGLRGLGEILTHG
jgi:hypothetical protein